VTRVVPHEQLLDAATTVLRECAWGAPRARAEVKRAINLQYGLYDRMAMDASLYDEEYAEGWKAFAERRAPSWIPEDIRPDGRI
jgi:enoyl-CoA hydratase/carnithine racemase